LRHLRPESRMLAGLRVGDRPQISRPEHAGCGRSLTPGSRSRYMRSRSGQAHPAPTPATGRLRGRPCRAAHETLD
jgi:hypothetical protein